MSSATRLLRDPELREILETARANNAKLQVTGMLLYANGSFIQVLEGDPAHVERLVRKIRRDPRHRGFLLLLDRLTVERDFDGWSMGFQHTTQQELDRIAGFHSWTAEMPTRRRAAAGVLLIKAFRRASVTH